MFKKGTYFHKLLFVILLINLYACGGSTTDSDAEDNPDTGPNTPLDSDVRTGRLGASPIEGIYYETATQSGVTDSEGSFHYKDDEYVVFSLGPSQLGKLYAKSAVSLFDLAGQAPVFGEEDAIAAWENSELNTIANLASFLHTLDVDADPSNGITVPTSLSFQAEDRPVDFSVDISKFRTQYPYRKILKQANDQGLLSNYRTPVPAWTALDSLYEHSSLDPNLNITASIIAPEYLSNYNYSITFNDSGIVEQVNIDFDWDGSDDKVSQHQYTESGELEAIYFDYDLNGEFFLHQQFNYDRNGDFQSSLSDQDRNREIDESVTSIVNDYGQELERNIDSDYDQQTDIRRTSTYDQWGNRIFYEERDLNTNQVSQIERRVYDRNGNELRREDDLNDDGIIDFILTTTYDEYGDWLSEEQKIEGWTDYIAIRDIISRDQFNRITSETYDFDNDGFIDANNEIEYSSNLSIERVQFDNDSNGVYDETQELHFNSIGHNIYEKVEYDDGVSVYIFEKEYYPNGILSSEKFDDDGDGTYDREHYYREDGSLERSVMIGNIFSSEIYESVETIMHPSGLVLSTKRDFGNDGNIDDSFLTTFDAYDNWIRTEENGVVTSRVTRSYNNNGNPLREEFDYDADQVIDDIYVYEYDAQGNLTQMNHDYNGDGVYDKFERFTYDAHGNKTRFEFGRYENGTEQYSTVHTYQKVGWHWIFEGQWALHYTSSIFPY